MEHFEITDAEAYARAIIEHADWAAERIQVPSALLNQKDRPRSSDKRGIDSELTVEFDGEVSFNSIRVNSHAAALHAPEFDPYDVPEEAIQVIEVVWDGIAEQLPLGYLQLLERNDRIGQQRERLVRYAKSIPTEFLLVEMATKLVSAGGEKLGMDKQIIECIEKEGDPLGSWSVVTTLGGGQQVQLSLTGVLKNRLGDRAPWVEDAWRKRRPNIVWTRNKDDYNLIFPARVTFAEAESELRQLTRRLELKRERWAAAASFMRFTQSVIANAVALYEIAGYVPRWTEIDPRHRPVIEAERSDGEDLNHKRTMSVGEALLEAQRTDEGMPFEMSNGEFLDWAARVADVSQTTIRDALVATDCFGAPGRRGRKGDGLRERIDRTIQYALEHGEENSSSSDEGLD